MSKPSVGLWYNWDLGDTGTARRVMEAFVRLGWEGAELARYQRGGPARPAEHDLRLFVDDGRTDLWALPPKPFAVWLIDTHLDLEPRVAWAQEAEWVFVAQQDGVSALAEAGVPGAQWLPLACSPELDPDWAELMQHLGREAELSRKWDCCFVGHLPRSWPGHPDVKDRVAIMDALFRAFPNSWLASKRFFLEAAQRYAQARVALNVSIRQDLNMRFFECLSYGVCQVCNRDMQGWRALGYRDGVRFLGWDTLDEARERIQWALDNPKEREAVALAGQRKARAQDTYANRVERILSETIAR